MGKLESASFLLIIAVGCFLIQTTNGLIHVVGGAAGWEIPPNNTFFSQWAAPRTFGVNDQLVFPYRPGGHTVHQVTKEDFDTCRHDHVINQWAQGPTVMKLNAPGEYYFYSAVGTHCEMGQKLHITVGAKPGSDGIDWNARVRQQTQTPARRLLMLPTDQALDTI